MKKKKPLQKLQLNKLKIASLQAPQMEALMGGVPKSGTIQSFSCVTCGPECHTASCPITTTTRP